MQSQLPLNLFGLDEDDGLCELKKRYYELAMLCHPDRGGCSEDMVVVHAHYVHAKQELEAKEESVQRVQKANCALGSAEKGGIPDMRSIFDEVHGGVVTVADLEEPVSHSPPHYAADVAAESSGYGSLMHASEYRQLQAQCEGGGARPPTFQPATFACAARAHEPASSQRECRVVEREADGAGLLHSLGQLPTRESGFGLPTPTPMQLPITDYVAAHSAGGYSCIVQPSAATLAVEHIARIEGDINERLAEIQQ